MSRLPATMTAIEITRPGGPDVLQQCTRDVPEPGPGEVLISVAAAGVNRPDIMQRRGDYPAPPGASDIPGLEVAGTVVATGEGVAWPAIGDQVCALTPGGGYAEFCLTSASHCLPVPSRLSMAEAAALPETFFTVWGNVFDRGRLAAGEVLLVHGGTSGIGTTAIQMAKAFDARVFVTAGSDEKCRAARKLGADLAINYRTEDFVEAVKAETDGRGVDVVLDMVGGAYFERNLRAMAEDGRHMTIAAMDEPKVTLNLNILARRRYTIGGSTLRPQSNARKAAIAEALGAHVWPKIEAGAISPVIFARLPLTQARRAHEILEQGKHIGKLVLDVK